MIFMDYRKRKINIVLINGKAGSGKDTIAIYLKKNYNYTHLYYAYALKISLSTITGFPIEYFTDPELKKQYLPYPWDKYTSRMLHQIVGTDLLRNQLDQDVWVKNVATKINRIIEDEDSCLVDYGTSFRNSETPNINIVISDLRFDNELYVSKYIKSFHEINTKVFSVQRNGQTGNTPGGIAQHVSEFGITLPDNTIYIDNNGSFEDLYKQIDLHFEK
jgi:hypothetical protein